MRILHTIGGLAPESGGPAMALLGLVRAQRAAGLDVHVLAGWEPHERRDLLEAMQVEGIPLTAVGPCTGFLRRHPGIAPAARECVAAADVVHDHGLWEEIHEAATREARRQKKPYVLRPCGMLEPWSLGQGRWKKRAFIEWRLRRRFRHAAAVHFTSRAERESARPLGLRAPSFVLPNGLPAEHFGLPVRDPGFRARFAISDEARVLLFFGRIHRKKGLHLLLPAFARKSPGDTILVVAGRGDDAYQADLQRQARDLAIEERVRFTGHLDGADRLQVLAEADLFVLPSHQENFGNAVLEALAAGLPVLVSENVALHTLVARHRLGAVFPLTEEAIGRSLEDWLAPGRALGPVRSRCRRVASRYRWDRIAAHLLRHYSKVLAR